MWYYILVHVPFVSFTLILISSLIFIFILSAVDTITLCICKIIRLTTFEQTLVFSPVLEISRTFFHLLHSFIRSMGRFENNRAHNKWVFIHMSCLTISFIFLLMVIYVIFAFCRPEFESQHTNRAKWQQREYIT